MTECTLASWENRFDDGIKHIFYFFQKQLFWDNRLLMVTVMKNNGWPNDWISVGRPISNNIWCHINAVALQQLHAAEAIRSKSLHTMANLMNLWSSQHKWCIALLLTRKLANITCSRFIQCFRNDVAIMQIFQNKLMKMTKLNPIKWNATRIKLFDPQTSGSPFTSFAEKLFHEHQSSE